MGLSDWVKYITDLPECEICGKKTSDMFHGGFCFYQVFGYWINEEKFASSSKVYFFNINKNRRKQ